MNQTGALAPIANRMAPDDTGVWIKTTVFRQILESDPAGRLALIGNQRDPRKGIGFRVLRSPPI